MYVQSKRLGNALVAISIVIACAGGVFFGLFSCGGYLWHAQLYWSLAALFVVLALLSASSLLRTWPRRVAFPFAFAFIFIFCQSVAAPFYPTAPSSITEFSHNFLKTLKYGSCQ